MTGIRTTVFRGMAPRFNKRRLANNLAQAATNCKIGSGGLVPYKRPSQTADPGLDSIVTIWRHRFGSEYNWLVFDADVSVVRSSVAQETRGRMYWTGDGEPRMSTYADAVDTPPYPDAFYVLGVEPPKAAMAVTPSGGVGAASTRAYIHTLKTQFGEESGPSDAVTATGKVDDTWTLNGFGSLPVNSWSVTGIVLDGDFATVTVSGDLYGTYAYEQIVLSGVTGVTDLNAEWEIDEIVSSTVFKIATNLTGTPGGTIAATRVAPHNTTDMTRCIYRAESSGTYFFVAEIDATDSSYADTLASTALGEAPNEAIRTPPKNGHSLVDLPNGCFAMLAGNELCFSEPYLPHSWPTANRYAIASQGIALGVAQNAVIVLTDGMPVLVVATQPDSASPSTIETPAPCVSRRGVVQMGGGCIYPSHDGLYLATPSSVVNLTENVFQYDEWRALMPETFVAALHDQTYYAHFTPAEGASMMLAFDVQERDSVVYIDYQPDALYANPHDGKLYVAKDGLILEWDADEANPMTMYWQGKEHQTAKPVNMGAAQVYADYDEIIPIDDSVATANVALMADADDVGGAIADDEIGLYEILGDGIVDVSESTDGSVLFTLLSDDEIVFTKSLSSDRAFRLPPGYKSDKLAVAVSATIPVTDIAVDETMSGLKTV